MPEKTLLRALSAVTLAGLTAMVWAAPTLGAPRPPTPPCLLSAGVTFYSSHGAIVITGTPGNDTIDCSANTKKAFTIYGNGSSAPGDRITGGAKDDTITVGSGPATVMAGPGNDTIISQGGWGYFYADTGADSIDLRGALDGSTAEGGDGNDVIQGSPFHDVLFGNAGEDTIDGGAGNDELDGGSGLDHMAGGDGNDVLADGGPEADYLDAGAPDLPAGTVGADVCLDGDGYGTSTDGTVGVGGSIQDDYLTSCEVIRVAVSWPLAP